MTLRYFYYKMSSLGKWCPQKATARPGKKTLGGGTQSIAMVTELKDSELGMDLDELAQRYPISGP